MTIKVLNKTDQLFDTSLSSQSISQQKHDLTARVSRTY